MSESYIIPTMIILGMIQNTQAQANKGREISVKYKFKREQKMKWVKIDVGFRVFYLFLTIAYIYI